MRASTGARLRRVLTSRKLLLATVGLATISYVACTDGSTSGNLMATPLRDSAADREPPPTSGNLMPAPFDSSMPDAPTDTGAGQDAAPDASDAGMGDADAKADG